MSDEMTERTDTPEMPSDKVADLVRGHFLGVCSHVQDLVRHGYSAEAALAAAFLESLPRFSGIGFSPRAMAMRWETDSVG